MGGPLFFIDTWSQITHTVGKSFNFMLLNPNKFTRNILSNQVFNLDGKHLVPNQTDHGFHSLALSNWADWHWYKLYSVIFFPLLPQPDTAGDFFLSEGNFSFPPSAYSKEGSFDLGFFLCNIEGAIPCDSALKCLKVIAVVIWHYLNWIELNWIELKSDNMCIGQAITRQLPKWNGLPGGGYRSLLLLPPDWFFFHPLRFQRYSSSCSMAHPCVPLFVVFPKQVMLDDILNNIKYTYSTVSLPILCLSSTVLGCEQVPLTDGRPSCHPHRVCLSPVVQKYVQK